MIPYEEEFRKHQWPPGYPITMEGLAIHFWSTAIRFMEEKQAKVIPEASATPETPTNQKLQLLREACERLERERDEWKEMKRPWSDAHAKSIIDAQVQDIDRLTALVQSERTARDEARKERDEEKASREVQYGQLVHARSVVEVTVNQNEKLIDLVDTVGAALENVMQRFGPIEMPMWVTDILAAAAPYRKEKE